MGVIHELSLLGAFAETRTIRAPPMMLLSARSFAWSDVVVRRWLVRHPAFIVQIVETKGVFADDRFPARAHRGTVVPEWPGVGIPLRGRGAMWNDGNDRASVDVARGSMALVQRGGDLRRRTDAQEAFEAFIQWDPAVLGWTCDAPLALATLEASALDRLEVGLRTISASSAAHPPAHAGVIEPVASLFGQLHDLGLCRGRLTERDLVASIPPRLARVGRALDDVLSRPGTRPKLVDLCDALGCSDRLARHLVGEYAEVYALEGVTEWRGFVRAWTMYLARLLMTSRDATTDSVARLLGYGSSNALCHALANAGLPPPGEMRRAVTDWV
jgi:AraC-like DNA-binding protein